MFKNLTLASIYELQGHKEEALLIYQEVLRRDPSNFEAKQAVARLGRSQIQKSANPKAKTYFIKAQSSEELKTLERWLMSWN